MQEWGSFGNRPICDAKLAHAEFAAKGWDASAINLANTYRCPRGIGPGEAYVLMLRRDAEICQQFEPLTGTIPFQTLVLGCDESQISVANMVFVDSQVALPSTDNDQNSLYLCHLADVRYVMLRQVMTASYNVRSLGSPTAEYFSDTEDANATTLYNGNPGPGRGPWTWRKMLGDIWAQFSSEIPSAPSIGDNVFPAQNPERFRFIEQSPLTAYSEALRSLFMDLVFNPATSTFSIVTLGAADSNFTQLQQSLTGSLIDQTLPLESRVTWFPESVDVVFLALYGGTPELALTVQPYYVLNASPTSYPSPTTLVVAGTKERLFAPLDAQMPCSGPIPVPSTWKKNTAYVLGNYVEPITNNGHSYICTTAGTSGATEPAFPTGVGATVNDGSVVWTEQTIVPTNYPALSALTGTLAANYYQARDQAMRRKVFEYSGIQGFVPGSLVECVTWQLGPNGATTTVEAVE